MIIAVPLRTIQHPEYGVWSNHYYLCDHFKEIFEELGITLFPVFPAFSKENVMEIEKVCDGLILSGSNKNIFPEYYGQERMPEMEKTYTVDEYSRDIMLLDAFVKSGKPVLGICGGIQTLNVFFGGTLKQLVPGHNSVEKGHMLHIEKDSFLYDVYGKDVIDGNSYHLQCSDIPAPGFKVTARAEDGTIEGIEKGNIIGVQWHPEAARDMQFFKKYVETFY